MRVFENKKPYIFGVFLTATAAILLLSPSVVVAWGGNNNSGTHPAMSYDRYDKAFYDVVYSGISVSKIEKGDRIINVATRHFQCPVDIQNLMRIQSSSDRTFYDSVAAKGTINCMDYKGFKAANFESTNMDCCSDPISSGVASAYTMVLVNEFGQIPLSSSNRNVWISNWERWSYMTEEACQMDVLPGDLNMDGCVTFEEFKITAMNSRKRLRNGGWSEGDFDGNGVVDYKDKSKASRWEGYCI